MVMRRYSRWHAGFRPAWMAIAAVGLQAVPVQQHSLDSSPSQSDAALARLRGGGNGLNGRGLDEDALAAHGDPLMSLLAGSSGSQAHRDQSSAKRSWSGDTGLRLKLRAAVTGGKTSPREQFEPTVEDLLLTVRGNRKRKYQSKLSRNQARAQLAADRGAEHTLRMDKRASMAPGARSGREAVEDGVIGGRARERGGSLPAGVRPPNRKERRRALGLGEGEDGDRVHGAKPAEGAVKGEKEDGAVKHTGTANEEEKRLRLQHQATVRAGTSTLS